MASTVNGGYLMTPYVVDNMTDDTGNVVWQAETDIKRQVVSEEVSEQIRAMMENNVGHTGTSNDLDYHGCASAYVAGYRIGGKSGTGEQLDWKGAYKYRPDGDYRKAISFAAILPADDPEILVLVMMDDRAGSLTTLPKLWPLLPATSSARLRRILALNGMLLMIATAVWKCQMPLAPAGLPPRSR